MPESSLVRNVLLRSAGIARALVLSRPPDYVLGPELLANPDFDTDTVWAKGVNWTISGGVATLVAGSASTLTQTGLTLTSGHQYYLTVVFLALGGFGLQPRLNGTPGTTWNVPGSYSQVMVAGASGGSLAFNSTSTSTAQIASVSLRKIL